MKVSFLIDGFNLYHSIEDVEKYKGIKAKWLDIKTSSGNIAKPSHW